MPATAPLSFSWPQSSEAAESHGGWPAGPTVYRCKWGYIGVYGICVYMYVCIYIYRGKDHPRTPWDGVRIG